MRTLLVLGALGVGALQAADLELQQDTLQAWDDYMRQATVAADQLVHAGKPFLRIAENQDRIARVRKGEVVVWAATENSPRRVPSGLIHDWMGAAFIPNVRIDDVIAVLRNYSRYKDIYKPGVLDARLVKQEGTGDRYSMLVRNGSFFTRTALDGEYDTNYCQVDDTRWYSVSSTVSIREVENYGQPGEHKQPPDRGHGYVWRVAGFSRFEQRDGGVFMEDEVIVLSRDVPTALRWMAGPIIRRVARETIATSINSTRTAATTKAGETNVTAKRPPDAELCAHTAAAGCPR